MRFEVRFTTFHVNDRVGSKRWYTIWASVSIKFASVHIRRCGTRLTSSPPIQQARTTPGFCTFVSCLYANIAKIAKLLANPVPPHFDTVARLTHKKCDERKYDIEDAALSYLIRHVFIVYSQDAIRSRERAQELCERFVSNFCTSIQYPVHRLKTR